MPAEIGYIMAAEESVVTWEARFFNYFPLFSDGLSLPGVVSCCHMNVFRKIRTHSHKASRYPFWLDGVSGLNRGEVTGE